MLDCTNVNNSTDYTAPKKCQCINVHNETNFTAPIECKEKVPVPAITPKSDDELEEEIHKGVKCLPNETCNAFN